MVGKSEGKRLLERPRRRWKANVRNDVTEIGWEIVGWIHLAQDSDQWRAVANTIMKLRFP
jgi:hypothetical protein